MIKLNRRDCSNDFSISVVNTLQSYWAATIVPDLYLEFLSLLDRLANDNFDAVRAILYIAGVRVNGCINDQNRPI